jgi:hypothetical protein
LEGPALLDALVALAQEAGVTVRVVPRGPDHDGGVRSGACRMRGEPWLLLAARDSVEDRIDAAVAALRAFAPELIAQRYLPPALRKRLEGDAG